jgi:hypothetical protein
MRGWSVVPTSKNSSEIDLLADKNGKVAALQVKKGRIASQGWPIKRAKIILGVYYVFVALLRIELRTLQFGAEAKS